MTTVMGRVFLNIEFEAAEGKVLLKAGFFLRDCGIARDPACLQCERRCCTFACCASEHSECHVHFFFPLATSADRFYRIDRSQVSFFCLLVKVKNSQCDTLYRWVNSWTFKTNMYKFCIGACTLSCKPCLHTFYKCSVCFHLWYFLYIHIPLNVMWLITQMSAKITCLANTITNLPFTFPPKFLHLLLSSWLLCLFKLIPS